MWFKTEKKYTITKNADSKKTRRDTNVNKVLRSKTNCETDRRKTEYEQRKTVVNSSKRRAEIT